MIFSQCAIQAALWCVWLDRIYRKECMHLLGVLLSPNLIQQRVTFLVSLSCSIHGEFKGVAITDLQSCSEALLCTQGFSPFFFLLLVFTIQSFPFWRISYPLPCISLQSSPFNEISNQNNNNNKTHTPERMPTTSHHF